MKHRQTALHGPTRFSLHIHDEQRLVVISVNSGVLVKHCSNGYWADDIEVHRQSSVRF